MPRMQKTITLAAILMLALTSSAMAGGKEGSIGVGAEFAINGIAGGQIAGGPSLNYDAGIFHAGGFFGFNDGGGDDDTDFSFGGRFYWHLHDTPSSDFGIGAGLAFLSVDSTPDPDRELFVFIEPSFQFRAFVANNVALSFTGGFSFALADAEGASLGAQNNLAGFQLLGGIHYYFFK